ncbi:hypothetical protein ACJX0J_027530 [Zea mays]
MTHAQKCFGILIFSGRIPFSNYDYISLKEWMHKHLLKNQIYFVFMFFIVRHLLLLLPAVALGTKFAILNKVPIINLCAVSFGQVVLHVTLLGNWLNSKH